MVGLPEMVLREDVALLRRLAPPADGFGSVGGYALAILVRLSEKQLGRWIALLGGSPVPGDRLGFVSGNTGAHLIRRGQVECSGYVTLLGCAPPPLDRLRHVLRDTVTAGVLSAEDELCRRVALLRRLALRRRDSIRRPRGVFSWRRERGPRHVVECRGARAARTEHAGDGNREGQTVAKHEPRIRLLGLCRRVFLQHPAESTIHPRWR